MHSGIMQRLDGRFLLALVIVAAAALLAVRATTPAHATTLKVTTTADNESNGCAVGECTLREAITQANANPDLDVITFDIPGSGPHTIQPLTALPLLMTDITIDGFCATCEGASANSLAIDQPSNALHTIVIDGTLLPGFYRGLTVHSGTATVRGIVFSNWSASGILIEGGTNHVITGNLIGTDVTGQMAAANYLGLELGNATGVRVGGPNPADRNVISGNTTRGIYAFAGSNTVIAGNFVGVAKDGTTAVPNIAGGVAVLNVANARVGGTTAAERNVIAGNGVQDGQVAGIDVEIAPAALIQGNYVGLDRTGAATPGVQGIGIHVYDSTDVVIRDNVVSGNGAWGIYALSANPDVIGLKIKGNLIGTDATGTSAVGNGWGGIMTYNAPGIVIGGGAAADGNTISGNGSGIQVSKNVQGMLVQGNRIGTDVTGTQALGNTGHGIRVYSTPSAAEVLIGGTGSQGNVIAYNGGHGIHLETAAAHEIAFEGNVIYANSGRSIELAPNGQNGNDAGDVDGGANDGQNYPVVASATRGVAGMAVHIALDTNGSQEVEIELFSSPSCGAGNTKPEARTFLGHYTVQLDSTGDLDATYTVANVPAGDFVTATATDDLGSTSELSPCVAVDPRPREDVNCDGVVDGVDALAVLRALAGLGGAPLPQVCAVDPATPAGDADGNQAMTLDDVLAIRRLAAGLP